MKKIALSIGALVMLALVSCGPSTKDAVAYNDKIMDIVNNLTATHNAFLNQMDGHNIDSLKITQQQFSEKAKASLEEVGKLGAFAEKKEFLDAATEYFKTISSMADVEGKQMVEIMSKDSAQVTMEDVAKVEELGTKFDADYEKTFNMIQEAQKKFAAEYKFEIEKTEEQH